MTCQICGSKTNEVIDFGQMPVANGFIEPDEEEIFYNLRLMQCEDCETVQLDEQPDREVMFNVDYPFFTSSSQRMVDHFDQLASQISPDAFVVEIGSNDGTFLENFPKHVGVEPSGAHFKALEKKIRSMNCFFSESVAEQIVDLYGQADVVYAANCLCHIKDVHEVLRGITWLLKDDGQFIFEDPYLGFIVERTAYDQIYDEHFYYWSMKSVIRLMDMYGLAYQRSIPLDVHGGSMRYYITRKKGGDGISQEFLEGGEYGEMIDMRAFADAVELKRDIFRQALSECKGKTIGYAATSKSTTVLNYCGAGPIEYIVDSTPEKQGKLTPGTHIPIKPVHSLEDVDNVVLLAPNHEQEIKAKHPEFKGRWIKY